MAGLVVRVRVVVLVLIAIGLVGCGGDLDGGFKSASPGVAATAPPADLSPSSDAATSPSAEPALTAPPTPAPTPTPSPSPVPFGVAITAESFRVRGGPLGAEFNYVVEVHNTGGIAASLPWAQSRFAVMGPGGEVLLTDDFIHVYPSVLQPGETGYLIAFGTFEDRAPADVARAQAELAYSPTVKETPRFTGETVRFSNDDSGALGADGEIRNESAGLAGRIGVAVIVFDKAGALAGGLVDPFGGRLPPGESKRFLARDSGLGLLAFEVGTSLVLGIPDLSGGPLLRVPTASPSAGPTASPSAAPTAPASASPSPTASADPSPSPSDGTAELTVTRERFLVFEIPIGSQAYAAFNLVVEVMNTGTLPVTVTTSAVTITDSAGGDVTADTTLAAFPGVIEPGATGYLIAGSEVAASADQVGDHTTEFEFAAIDEPAPELIVSETEFATAPNVLLVSARGRVTNASERSVSEASLGIVMFGEDGQLLGGLTAILDPMAPGETVDFETSTPELKLHATRIASFVVLANPGP